MSHRNAPGTLYLVSTPIGHLGDMTHRAVEVLRAVSLICAEDTRHVRTLLRRYDISTRVASHHDRNEAKTTPALVGRLTSGADIALVSDAGTPLLSDPGQRLVHAALAAGVAVVPVPGASALLAALVASGLDAGTFTFFGFLPRGSGDRERVLARLSALEHTSVLYESPMRLAATLHDLVHRGLGDREAVVARELTKKHEEFRRGTLAQLEAYYRDNPARGEVVVLLQGHGGRSEEPEDAAVRDAARAWLANGATRKDVVMRLVQEHGVARNRAYRITQEIDR
jgi:16S rRNA (cytidine1402-2'-O)-methyltransferase